MFTDIEDLKLISVVEGSSARAAEFRSRASHAFVFKLSGASDYFFPDRTLRLSAGQAIYLPKGASYTARKVEPERESRYICLNFEGAVAGAVPAVYSADGFADLGLIRSRLQRMWLFGGASERYRCHAVFYQFLSFVAKAEGAQYALARHARLIQPGVEYLREHIFDCELRIRRLSELCSLSDTYFRQLFRASFGVTPREYVINRRLAQAQAILSGGDVDTVAQAAQAVGYSDALYFSRLFAGRYGMPPSAYVRALQSAR